VLARIIGETVWHPSQVLTKQKDGSLVMELQVMDTVELAAWIMGWGAHVEVLEPVEMRAVMVEAACAVLINYGQKLPL
jgi:predicted DNA-binding transcriptional regulator YafY